MTTRLTSRNFSLFKGDTYYVHKRNRDVAIVIYELSNRRAFVSFHNINYSENTGKKPIFISTSWIRLDDYKNYKIWDYDKWVKQKK